jgi:hypothetical protein
MITQSRLTFRAIGAHARSFVGFRTDDRHVLDPARLGLGKSWTSLWAVAFNTKQRVARRNDWGGYAYS